MALFAKFDTGNHGFGAPIEALNEFKTHPNISHCADDEYLRPEIDNRRLSVGMAKIRKSGGIIRNDGAGLTFNYPKKPENEQEVEVAFKLAQDACEAFFEIRPLIVKTIDLFPVRGLMVKAVKVFEKISVVFPDSFSEKEKIQYEGIIKELSLTPDDFVDVGGVI